ncbi:MAG: VanZ family protein [Terriglobales bacterium]
MPALFWLAVIAWESTPLASSEETGKLLFPLVRFFAPHISIAQWALVHGAVRKAGHFFGYAVLSLLMLRAWWATLNLPPWAARLPSLRAMARSWSLRATAIALGATVLVAGLDEWHQTMLPGRTGSFYDVLLDSSAALCVQLMVIAVSDVRPKLALD